MSQTLAGVQVVLVVENPDNLPLATAALGICCEINWIEVHDRGDAVKWLHSQHADVVVVSLQSTLSTGLALLRQNWFGPIICLCNDDDATIAAVDAAKALAIVPPFSSRQIANAVRLFVQMGDPFALPPQANGQAAVAPHGSTEQTLHESERRLEQAQRMEAVGRLAGGVAHDFNNLLTVIGSYSELAMRKLDDGHVVVRYVEQIRKASSTAASLTRQLLAFSRRQVLQPRVIAFNEVVEEISFMVQSLLGAAVELRIRLDPELGQIEADPAQLQQVLLNLIVNSKDAMPDGGLLSIETRNFELDAAYARQYPNARPGSYVRLSVADSGVGMDGATLARMYEPFFTTKPKGRGTGLGLPTVYGIVQQSGGFITAYSEVGRGTTFHIYMPRVDKSTEPVRLLEESYLHLCGCETILLVEDEAGVRDVASMILQEAGYHILAAGTPEEAMMIETHYEGPINLLLTDVIMPHMTGRDMAHRLAHRRPQMPVVYMSGYTEDVMAFQQLLEAGAHLIEKPFYPTDLLRMVRRAIELSLVAPIISPSVAPLSVPLSATSSPN